MLKKIKVYDPIWGILSDYDKYYDYDWGKYQLSDLLIL